jgi:hypothetical protein
VSESERSFYPRLVLDEDDLRVIRAWFRATYGNTPVSRIEMVTAFAWIKVTEAVIAEAEQRHM